MNKNSILYDNRDKYFIIFSDCFITKGQVKSSILDITNQKMYFFDTQFYDLLSTIGDYKIEEILLMCEDNETIINFQDLILFLISNDLGMFVNDTSLFPAINIEWNSYSIITNAIIDVKDRLHDFNKILIELNELDCEKLQIRFYSEISIEIIYNIISIVSNKRFSHVEFLIRESSVRDQLNDLIDICRQYPFVHFTIYASSIKNKNMKYVNIDFRDEDIDFCEDCGIITPKYFIIPTLQSYMENRLYNGCLNRKVSIDQNGDIKNCPSLKFNYGNIKDVSIKDIVTTKQFQRMWKINKSMIEVCQVCELRSLCTDCRAHISDINNIYSKPKKCNYDPSTSTWN